MSKSLGIVGWIAAMIAIVGFAGYVSYSEGLEGEIRELRAKNKSLVLNLGEVRRQVNQHIKTISKIPAAVEEIEKLQTSLVLATEQIAELEAEKESSRRPVSLTTDDGVANAPSERRKGLAAMLKLGQNETMARVSVDMQYGQLMQDLNLPSEVVAQMTDILATASRAQMDTALKMMSENDELTGSELKNAEENRMEGIRRDLSQILSTDEMSAWEEFEVNKIAHLIQQQYDTQLGMFAIGLTTDNKSMVRDVLVDESMLMKDLMRERDNVTDINSPMTEQLAIFKGARERLFTLMDSEQYAIAEKFINQQERMIRMAGEMLDLAQPNLDTHTEEHE